MDERGRKARPFGWLGGWKLSQKDQKESGVPPGGREGLEDPTKEPGGVSRAGRVGESLTVDRERSEGTF